MYELLTGVIPTDAFKYSGNLKGVLKKCLAFNPNNRYGCVEQVITSLNFIRKRIPLLVTTVVTASLLVMLIGFIKPFVLPIEVVGTAPELAAVSKYSDESDESHGSSITTDEQNDKTLTATITPTPVTTPILTNMKSAEALSQPNNLTSVDISATATPIPTTEPTIKLNSFPDFSQFDLSEKGFLQLINTPAVAREVGKLFEGDSEIFKKAEGAFIKITCSKDYTYFFAERINSAWEISSDGSICIKVNHLVVSPPGTFEITTFTNNQKKVFSGNIHDWEAKQTKTIADLQKEQIKKMHFKVN